jgi:hypothetical protein
LGLFTKNVFLCGMGGIVYDITEDARRKTSRGKRGRTSMLQDVFCEQPLIVVSSLLTTFPNFQTISRWLRRHLRPRNRQTRCKTRSRCLDRLQSPLKTATVSQQIETSINICSIHCFLKLNKDSLYSSLSL